VREGKGIEERERGKGTTGSSGKRGGEMRRQERGRKGR